MSKQASKHTRTKADHRPTGTIIDVKMKYKVRHMHEFELPCTMSYMELSFTISQVGWCENDHMTLRTRSLPFRQKTLDFDFKSLIRQKDACIPTLFDKVSTEELTLLSPASQCATACSISLIQKTCMSAFAPRSCLLLEHLAHS